MFGPEKLQECNMNALMRIFCAICKQSSGNFSLVMKDKINKLNEQQVDTSAIAIALVNSSRYWLI